MSKENARNYLKKGREDEGLAREADIDSTVDDLRELNQARDGVLTNEELTQVSGGTNAGVLCPNCGSGNVVSHIIVTPDGKFGRTVYYCFDCKHSF